MNTYPCSCETCTNTTTFTEGWIKDGGKGWRQIMVKGMPRWVQGWRYVDAPLCKPCRYNGCGGVNEPCHVKERDAKFDGQ